MTKIGRIEQLTKGYLKLEGKGGRLNTAEGIS